jgi:hypothetical protein
MSTDFPTATWTAAGGPDPACDAVTREERHARLTDPHLAERFQQRYPAAEPVYDRMIRALDLVWDCPDDDTVNVVGYCCAGCGASREVALLKARCREGGEPPTAETARMW